MKKILSLAAILFTSFAAFAQTGKVTGQAAGAQKPVESASVGLLRVKDSAVVKRTSTDKNGQFTIDQVAEGRYLVVIQSVGFAKYYSEPFSISLASQSYVIRPASLQPAAKALQEVTVVSKRPFVEQKIDRTIINVDATPSNTGTTALEVLEKSPGISVDKDGNISLKGKQGVMIMLDGKPTYLSGEDLTNMLKNMPSANLDQIEIMTNPPAKFDASGNSGVINIKTKKNRTMGYNGSITSSYGQGVYGKNNHSVNMNYRDGKFNFFGNASYYYGDNFNQIGLVRKFRNATGDTLLSVFDQASRMMHNSKGINYKVGFDYFANKKTTLGIVVNGYDNRNSDLTDNNTRIEDASYNLASRTLATNAIKTKYENIGLNFNLRHQFDSTGKELTSDIDYINYTSNQNQLLSNHFFDNLGNKSGADEILLGNFPSTINIYSARVDYLQPLKNNGRFEAGVKSSYVQTDNDAQYSNWNSSLSQYVPDLGRSNHFLYKENINAAYINEGRQLSKKWNAQLGLRLENTNLQGNQITSSQSFSRSYTQIFPTVFIGYTPNANNQFSVNYGRRIDRPNYQDLNPFINFLDKYTYQQGNPMLNPQFSHNFELNHTYRNMLTTSLSYSITNDIMQDILEQVDSTHTSFIRKGNIAKRKSLSLSMNLGMPLTKWWRTNAYANVFNNYFSGLINNGYVEVSGTSFMTNVTNIFTFAHGWGAELSGYYRSGAVQGVLVSNPMWAMNAGISKNVLKNKGSVRLSVRDIFYTQQFSGYSKYQNVDVTIDQSRDSRVVNLSFTYRFSKGKTAAQRKRGGANDEQNRINSGGGN